MFDRWTSPKICCKGFCCPECLFGENAAKMTDVSCGTYLLLTPMVSCGLIHMPIRTKLRENYGSQEEPSDVVAVCQEAREIIF